MLIRVQPTSISIERKRRMAWASFLVGSFVLWSCGGPGYQSSNPIAPEIITQPADQNVAVGQAAMFSVVATGTAPLYYQWQKNNTNISGATSSSYTTPAAASGDNNSTFRVMVTNSAGSATSSAATLHITAPVGPSITTQPASQTVTAGQTATFTVVATGTPPLSYQWQKNNANIPAAASSTYTTPPLGASDNNATFRVIVTNAASSAQSNSVALTVLPSETDVTTYHNDNARTGQNLTETILTQANVNAQTFGLLRNLTVDGGVDAEPLYLSHLSVNGAVHNVVFVATEHDSVYAFDSDTGALLWSVSFIAAGSGETTVLPADVSCTQVSPELGITATPVIDRAAGAHGILYLVAMSKTTNGSSYFQRLHALDVATGAEIGTPVTIQATYPGNGPNSSGGQLVFDPKQYKERAALLLLNGVIYTGWASHCDNDPYNGWIIGYHQSNLAQQPMVLNLTPNGTRGSIWQSGGGLAADPQGYIYALLGNGTFDTTLDYVGYPSHQNYGNAFIKVVNSSGTLLVLDYFDMFNTVSESVQDTDLGSGGPMVLPDSAYGTGATLYLAVGAGKDGNIYLVNRNSVGRFSTTFNNVYQEVNGALPDGVYGVPAYFQNTVYYCDVNSTLKSFPIVSGLGMLATSPTQATTSSFTRPGVLPSISANGSSDGIVWAIENTATAVLHAYPANDLARELYNSNQAAAGRDHFGSGNKFITPMIADGKVFAATTNSVAVFSLLP